MTMAVRLTCEWCGQKFARPHQRGPAPKFCSNAHRQRAHEARRFRRLERMEAMLSASAHDQAEPALVRAYAHHVLLEAAR